MNLPELACLVFNPLKKNPGFSARIFSERIISLFNYNCAYLNSFLRNKLQRINSG